MQASLPVRLFRFMLAVSALVLVVFLAQFPIQWIPAFRAFSEVADKYDIRPGALYYTDVPVTPEAERFTRSAVRAVDERKRQARAAKAERQ